MHAQRTTVGRTVRLGQPAGPATARREVRGNLIHWRFAAPQASRAATDTTAFHVPRPGEDGEPQAISQRAFDISLALLCLTTVVVFLTRLGGAQ